ncbi:MAG: class I SAM-dependent methyltransferase [Clostridia bacterium]|nr:class I SAM-dependent methyltransferase [Clostridia bacterium]
MDNTDKFNHKADAYSYGRPTYANTFIDMLYSEQGFNSQSIIADIGSGTGILSKQLLDKGSTIYAVEPNTGMRITAENILKSFKNFYSVNGTAEHTTLQNNSVDFITAAQAFHWFNGISFKKECTRILKPNGKVFLIWNTRDTAADVNIRQGLIFKKYCPDFAGFSGGIKENDDRICAFFDNKFVRAEFDNPLLYAREKFIQRCLSGSYSLNEKDKNYNEYLQALYDFFDINSINGLLTVPNKTIAYFGTVAGA